MVLSLFHAVFRVSLIMFCIILQTPIFALDLYCIVAIWTDYSVHITKTIFIDIRKGNFLQLYLLKLLDFMLIVHVC